MLANRALGIPKGAEGQNAHRGQIVVVTVWQLVQRSLGCTESAAKCVGRLGGAKTVARTDAHILDQAMAKGDLGYQRIPRDTQNAYIRL